MAASAAYMPTVAYGLGATKAGTSWLYRYLDDHPDCAMPVPKELHFFDRAEGFFKRDLIEEYSKRVDYLQANSPRAAKFRSYLKMLRAEDRGDAAYSDYVARTAGDAKLFADITPAYGLVSTPMLVRMAAIAPVTRFVFIMRDPVARLWSNIRMEAHMQARRKGADAAQLAEEMAGRYLDDKRRSVALRSDYTGMLQRLADAVPSAHVFVEFYERLFSAPVIERLCAFLGISHRPADFETKVHQGERMDMPAGLHTALRAKLAPQYAGVAAQFNDLPDAWQRQTGGA